MKHEQYDIIIGGGGAAGLSLAYFLSKQENSKLKVLLIDSESKNSNDRTWCSWVPADDEYNRFATKIWDHVDVFNRETKVSCPLSHYRYRMIRSADFYVAVHRIVDMDHRFDRLQAKILKHSEQESGVIVETDRGSISGTRYFPSFTNVDAKAKAKYYLAQHFKGWYIRSPKAFDDRKVTLMDFRIEEGSDCRFMYVLPTSKDTALIEATAFSPEVWQSEAYDQVLTNYLSTYLSLAPRDYLIEEVEVGVIPMSDYRYQDHNTARVRYIGSAGGSVRPSSGYAFSKIVKSMKALANELVTGEKCSVEIHTSKRHRMYDQALLQILMTRPDLSGKVFIDLFHKNDPELVMKFLDEETTISEELKIMSTTDKLLFTKALAKVVLC